MIWTCRAAPDHRRRSAPSRRSQAVAIALAALGLPWLPSSFVSAESATSPLDLTSAGIKATLEAPEGAAAKQFLSTTRVSKPGGHFSLEITPEPIYPMEFGAAKDAAKREAKATFRTESAETIVWESTSPSGGRASHFYYGRQARRQATCLLRQPRLWRLHLRRRGRHAGGVSDSQGKVGRYR